MKSVELARKEQQEIDAWRDSTTESPASDSVENIVNKLTDAPVFLEAFTRHQAAFRDASSILELGAGQGWASCMVKKLVGARAMVTATDISPYAIASIPKWERIFNVRLDGRFDCRSYQVPLPDASMDLIFTFQAAHHFVAHRRTLAEVQRLLKPRGTCLYLHEPTCTRWLHAMAHHRVNRKGMPVPEDVLVYAQLEHLGEQAGLEVSSAFDLSLAKRGPVELLYYVALRMMPPLRHLLPCTRDITFLKAATAS